MRVIDIGDMKIAVGLEWDSVSLSLEGGKSRSPSKAVGELLATKKGVRYGIKIRNGAVISVGTVPPGNKLPKAPSGMALLAFASQAAEENKDGQSIPSSQSVNEANSILVENLGDGTYWVALVLEGMPLPNGDIVGQRREIIDVLQDMMTSSPFTLNSPDEDIRSQFASLAAQTTDRGFARLVKSQDIRPSKGNLSQIAGIPPVAIYALVFVLTAVCIWVGYYYLVKKGQDAAAEAAARARAAQKEQEIFKARTEYEGKVQKAVLAALDEGRREVNAIMTAPSPAGFLSAWGAGVLGLPRTVAGWTPSAVDCLPAQPQSACTVSLSRTPDSTFRMLLSARPDAEIDGERATYAFNVASPAPRPFAWKDLRSARAFNVDLLSDLQLLKRGSGVGYKVGASKEITKSVKMPPPPPEIFKAGTAQPAPKVPPVNMGVSTGSLTLTGLGLWQIPGVARLMDDPALSAVSMKFNPTAGVADSGWVLSLTYIIRTSPTPVLPVIVLPDKSMLSVPLPAEYAGVPDAALDAGVGTSIAASPDEPIAPPVAPPAAASSGAGEAAARLPVDPAGSGK